MSDTKRVTQKVRAEVTVPDLITDRNVCGPEVLEIRDGMQNSQEIAAWWGRVKLYAEAMHALDRVVTLHHVEDERYWYLASIEAEVPPSSGKRRGRSPKARS
jgi:hypothetical protein